MIDYGDIVLTNHAIVRSQQRGVSIDVVKLVAIYGHKNRAKHGNKIRTMRSKDANRLLNKKIEDISFIESARSVQIITKEENDKTVVVTVNGKMNK